MAKQRKVLVHKYEWKRRFLYRDGKACASVSLGYYTGSDQIVAPYKWLGFVYINSRHTTVQMEPKMTKAQARKEVERVWKAIDRVIDRTIAGKF